MASPADQDVNIGNVSAMVKSLNLLLSEQFGADVRCDRPASLFPAKQRSRKTLYLRFSCNHVPEGVFVKYSKIVRVKPDLERFLYERQNDDFRVPQLFGTGRGGGAAFAAWRNVTDRHLTNFDNSPDPQLLAIVRATAAVNKLTDDALRTTANLGTNLNWEEPFADQLGELLTELRQTGEMGKNEFQKEYEQYARAEPRALRRLQALGNQYLTHNDLNASNILIGTQPTLVDWETAALSPPGQSLRVFSTLPIPKQEMIANHYVDCMPQPHKVEDILFVMGAFQIQGWLRNAISIRSAEWVRTGLGSIQSLFIDRL